MKGDWTAQLAADHAPPAVGWWPPAPGWWGLLGLCLLLVLVWALMARRRASVRRPSPRSLQGEALAEIEHIEQCNHDDPAVARAIEAVLRRYAVALFGLERVARLTGASWLEFLGQHGGTHLAGDTGRALLEAAFAERGGSDRASWLRASKEFIQHARKELE